MGSLQVNRLRWVRPGADVLFDDVSFRVGDGEHVALVGANGVGKTTLLRVVAGGLDGASGTVNVDVEVHHIASSDDNTVLVERTDNCLDVAGTVVLSANCMATFVVEGDKIKRFSDYYDLKPFIEFGLQE